MHAVWRTSVFGNNQVARCLDPSPLTRPVTTSFVTTLISNQMFVEFGELSQRIYLNSSQEGGQYAKNNLPT